MKNLLPPKASVLKGTSNYYLEIDMLNIFTQLSPFRILEICCGDGMNCDWLQKFFGAEVIGIDFDKKKIEHALQSVNNRDVEFYQGNVFDLSLFPDQNFDLIFARSALHHLSYDIPTLSDELYRVLNVGGIIFFLNEPLGHNPLWAGIRSAINSKKQLTDESNLFLKHIQGFARNFKKYEIRYFNLISYPLKILPKSKITEVVSSFFYRIDQYLIKTLPRLGKYSANCNLIFFKS